MAPPINCCSRAPCCAISSSSASRRRLPALVVTAAIALYGVNAYLSLPVEAYPDVSNVQVVVIAQLAGQAPEEIERQVTVPIERVLNGTPGSILMRSESLFGLSLVTVTFDDDADSFQSRAIVNERLTEADLPEGVNVKLAPEATPLGEIYQFRVISDRHSLRWIRGPNSNGRSRASSCRCREWPTSSPSADSSRKHTSKSIPSRLLAHNLSLSDVSEAIRKSNRNVGGGFLTHGEQQLAIRGVGYLGKPEDLQAIVLKSESGTPVTVGDVSRVVLSHTPRLGGVGYNVEGEVAEGFALLRRGENPSVVLEGIHEKVAQLNDSILPKGMRIAPFYDRTRPRQRDARHGSPQSALRRAARGRRRLAVPAQPALFVDRRVDHSAGAAHRLHRPARRFTCRPTSFRWARSTSASSSTAPWCWWKTCFTRPSSSSRPAAAICCG